MKIDASDLKRHDRILFKSSKLTSETITEGIIIEVSPSRKWICIEIAHGESGTYWYGTDEVYVQEKLGREEIDECEETLEERAIVDLIKRCVRLLGTKFEFVSGPLMEYENQAMEEMNNEDEAKE